MIERIKKVFDDDADASAELESQLQGKPTQQYSTAMHFLLEWRDRKAVQAVVRDAVLEARSDPQPDRHWTDRELHRIDEDDTDGWASPPGLNGLAALLVEQSSKYTGPVLTTNFDPLLSAAIHRAGGQLFRTALTNDGRIPGGGNDTRIPLHVIHLHGYWLGSTLHTGSQLVAPRPMLRQSLQRILQEHTVVVIGYGGWDDIFMDTLRGMIFDEAIEIVWCFFEHRPGDLIDRYQDLFEKMQDLIQRSQFRIYIGIDCRTIFSQLHNAKPVASARLGPMPYDYEIREPSGGPTSRRTSSAQAADDRANGVSAERSVDNDSPGVSPDLAGLRAEQVDDLRDTVTIFDLFLAAAAHAADDPDEAEDDQISDTTMLLLSAGLQQGLDHLKIIRADNWPAVKWATPIGTMVVQAQRHLERYQHRAQSPGYGDDQGGGAPATESPQLKELRTSIEALRKHIVGHYPSLCASPEPGNRN